MCTLGWLHPFPTRFVVEELIEWVAKSGIVTFFWLDWMYVKKALGRGCEQYGWVVALNFWVFEIMGDKPNSVSLKKCM